MFGAIAPPSPGDDGGGGGGGLPAFGPPVVHLMDFPVVHESGVHHEPYFAAFARPWPGTVALWRSASGSGFAVVASVDLPAALGEIQVPPMAGPVWRWDAPNAMTVRLYRGALSTKDDLDVLAGANTIAARADDGRWQLLHFQRAILVGERTYRLERLITGQLGTEDIQATGLLAGAPVVILSGRVIQIPLARDQVGIAYHYRAGPADQGPGGDAVVAFQHTASGRGLMPYSPVHLTASRDSADSLRLAWLRRTRDGGDSWESEDVPLSEESERYRVEILDGGTVVRTAEVTVPEFIYSLAEQQADFGAALSAISFRVAQIAPGFGAGVPTEVTLDVG